MKSALYTALGFAALSGAVPQDFQAHYEKSHREWLSKRQSGIPSLGPLQGTVGFDNTYDYVVVGGGTGGLAIAERLAENKSITVAVVEAGTFYQIGNPELSSTPAGDVIACGSSPSDSNPLVDWNFVMQPQPYTNQRKHYARGKCLGGSSARNFMIYQRGTIGSYQRWADVVGDQSFTWSNILPFFKKSVKFTPPNLTKRAANASAGYNADAFSSSGGPLQVSYPNYAQSFDSYLAPAFNEIGMPTAADFNSGSLFGIQYCASTIDPKTEVRASSQETFLQYAINNNFQNLKVFDNSLAKKILFDNNKNAVGVNVQGSSGLPFTLNARKEVILSAGAFQSPQLLMVSGVGPANVLNNLNIPIVYANDQVGQNMKDHVFAGPTYRVNLQTFTRLANDLGYVASEFLGEYSQNQAGPLTNPVADMLGWEKIPASLRAGLSPSVLSDLASLPADWPEIEYISGAGYVGDFSNLLTNQPKDGYQYATILGTVVAPFSTGYVTINSSDTNTLPSVQPNWLLSPTDQAIAVASYKRARQAFATSAMKKVVIGDEYYPGKNVSSDAQILAQYQRDLLTVWHASCTCAMGKVVDTHARVIGVQRLRVVDASAFPFLPPGHPQSTIYMLAEKVAAQILAGQ